MEKAYGQGTIVNGQSKERFRHLHTRDLEEWEKFYGSTEEQKSENKEWE